jgi:hypothetical protein
MVENHPRISLLLTVLFKRRYTRIHARERLLTIETTFPEPYVFHSYILMFTQNTLG